VDDRARAVDLLRDLPNLLHAQAVVLGARVRAEVEVLNREMVARERLVKAFGRGSKSLLSLKAELSSEVNLASKLLRQAEQETNKLPAGAAPAVMSELQATLSRLETTGTSGQAELEDSIMADMPITCSASESAISLLQVCPEVSSRNNCIGLTFGAAAAIEVLVRFRTLGLRAHDSLAQLFICSPIRPYTSSHASCPGPVLYLIRIQLICVAKVTAQARLSARHQLKRFNTIYLRALDFYAWIIRQDLMY